MTPLTLHQEGYLSPFSNLYHHGGSCLRAQDLGSYSTLVALLKLGNLSSFQTGKCNISPLLEGSELGCLRKISSETYEKKG